MKLLSLGIALLLMLTMACGGDDDDSSGGASATDGNGGTAATQAPSDGGAAPTAAPSDSGGNASSGGGGSTLTLGDESIELGSVLCYLQEQDVAGSPGKILLTARATGQLASGDAITLDVTRYDEESLFTGDDIEVEVGDNPASLLYSWVASADLGTIEQDGSTLRVEGLTFTHSEEVTEITGGFELHC